MKTGSTRIWLLFFIVLTGINLSLFYYRKHFTYIPYAGYESLYKPCDERCKKNWRQFIAPYDTAELNEARTMLAEKASMQNKTSTIDKVLAIATFEYQMLHKQMGKPSQEFSGLSPMRQFYKLGSAKSEKLWCGNLAAIFAFFCWSEQITCRYVEIFNPGDHHVVNECFIPELNRWIMVDITTNTLLTQDDRSNYLNLQQFINNVANKAPTYKFLWKDSSSIKTKIDRNAPAIDTYYSEKNPVYYFSSLIYEQTYSPAEKVKRYFLPISWYAVYDQRRKTNLPFYIKISFFLLWVMTVIFLTSLFLQNRNHDRRKKHKEEL